MFYLGSPEPTGRQVAALTGVCSYWCPEQEGDKVNMAFVSIAEVFQWLVW